MQTRFVVYRAYNRDGYAPGPRWHTGKPRLAERGPSVLDVLRY